jgi:phosphopantothenoylcysteine decarboxylase/phosphopantothenate--cysteine ligase
MARILITAGPTRQHLDPVRYLTNASSGRMGAALVQAAIDAAHDVVVVSGPVETVYTPRATVVWVTSTEEMLAECQRVFPTCDGLIGVAAPCDYRPVRVAEHKIHKSGEPLVLHLVETPDVVKKTDQWLVGFALETEDERFRALAKMEKKSCDLMVLNGPAAIAASDNAIEVLDRSGALVAAYQGSKEQVAERLFALVEERLIRRRN